MYYIYHAFDKKVGITKDVSQRVEIEQGYRTDEYEIVATHDYLKEALEAEQKFNKEFGYKSTPFYHPDMKLKTIKCRIDTPTVSTGEDDLTIYEEVKFINCNGEEYTFKGDQIKEIDLKHGRHLFEGSYKYVYWNAIRNLHEKQNKEQEELVARQFNECADLDVEDTGASLDDVFNLQLSLQQKFPETADIGNQSIADTAMAAQRNLHAFLDEVMEMMDAMGGMKDGFKNGAWKYWKQDYQKAKSMKISDLSDRDLKELKFEYVDMFHFFINWGLMLGMTGTELINMYVSKNKENFDRQKRGY